jgi:hypothetical protein
MRHYFCAEHRQRFAISANEDVCKLGLLEAGEGNENGF